MPFDKTLDYTEMALGLIAGKFVMFVVKKDVQDNGGAFQMRADQDAVAEAVIHAMHSLFIDDEIEAVLLINA